MSTKYSEPDQAHMAPKSLKERRLSLGLSQQQVAYLAACSVSRVGQIERNLDRDESPVRDRIEALFTKVEQARGAERPA